MTNHDIEVLGLKLKTIRQKRGFTQAQLAELVDCSNTYICLLEKGSKCMSLDMFIYVDEVLERVDKEDIGFVILDEEGKDGQVLCPARWMDYCFDDDFGCIINSALRYSISRHTYMPGVVVNFIRKYINTLDTKTIDIAIEDITKAIEMNEVDDPAMWECLKEDLVARRDFLLEKANNLGKSQRQSVAQTTDKNGNDTYESTEY